MCRTAGPCALRSPRSATRSWPSLTSASARRKTYKLEDDADLERYLARSPPIDYIVEEFVEGQIVTYDGLAGQAGRDLFRLVVQLLARRHGVGQRTVDLYYWISREIADDVQEWAGRWRAHSTSASGRSTSRSSGSTDGRLVALEVNMRPPGGRTVDMFNFANDFDFYRSGPTSSSAASSTPPSRGHTRACMSCAATAGRTPLSHDDVMAAFGDL